jgi:protease II
MKGAKFSKHLIYSEKDKSWFIAIQKTDGPMLTFMPEEYIQNRDVITSEQKKEARNLAIKWKKERAEKKAVKAKQKILNSQNKPIESIVNSAGFKISVNIISNISSKNITIGRTPIEYKNPANWGESSQIHLWIRSRLDSLKIDALTVESFMVKLSNKDEWRVCDILLENIILTLEEKHKLQQLYT